ncbi:APSES transcription factor, putative [Talaromyces stipitatus ATCC 10500]|uniref:Cell pattern formation-associated protein stuA n=1 Tax=Talaromyces stipitatus (strain ATCC 10500 / CBS 375.48 / QM 6759 / NRRL 1006) TaxID=441959 RepID=B8LTF2_TALSN|nr:APSES transcription factor, putative [Talaromyces stipitatus ATCC 10500]EED23030.1 APSES transcription factor, putative [Talaromyces stipitatus ATCC 10500]
MRSLPKQTNPLILPDASPSYQELLGLRRLGKTHLTVKPAQIGTSNATKPENLGPFEYAHLRAPLPKDLTGSEIFPAQTTKQDTYFLMRRSKDGYISATGMFKIAFPWAKAEEEKAEREYVKSKTETSVDETAGNLWISPMLALELAKEYQMLDWVRALLDSTEIIQTPASSKKPITPPPKFEMPQLETSTELNPTSRTRSRRSASPAKSSPKKNASPRKSRAHRSTKESSVAATTAASASLQAALDGAADQEKEEINRTAEDTIAVAETIETKPKKTRSKKHAAVDDKVTVNVESTTETKDEIETTQTNVTVEMPVTLPDLPPAEDTEQMIAQAKKMVEEATKLQEQDTTAESSSPKASKKRKSDEVEEEDDENSNTPAQPTKKAKVLETKLRKERVRNRALVGVTATLALAAAIPYFF